MWQKAPLLLAESPIVENTVSVIVVAQKAPPAPPHLAVGEQEGGAVEHPPKLAETPANLEPQAYLAESLRKHLMPEAYLMPEAHLAESLYPSISQSLRR